jgi:hypothetical protein
MTYSIVVAMMVTRKSNDSPSLARSALLTSGCRLLASTWPALVRAASVSCGVSSSEEGELLAVTAGRLAAEYGLVAITSVGDNRLRVRFVRQGGDEEVPNGGT